MLSYQTKNEYTKRVQEALFYLQSRQENSAISLRHKNLLGIQIFILKHYFDHSQQEINKAFSNSSVAKNCNQLHCLEAYLVFLKNLTQIVDYGISRQVFIPIDFNELCEKAAQQVVCGVEKELIEQGI